MQSLIGYFRQLLAMWLSWILAVSGLIGFALLTIDSLHPTFSLPQWAFWALVGVIVFCFLGANVQLFAEKEKEKQDLLRHIAELEAVEAKLQIKLLGNGLGPSSDYDENGLPGHAIAWARIEIENTGYKSGDLMIGCDPNKTQLPGLFVVTEEPTAQLGYEQFTTLDAQARSTTQLHMEFVITELNPQAFACALQTPQSYIIVMKYYTRRIGSPSEEERLVLEGDLGHFREEVIKYWREFGFSELAEIAERQPESERQ
jgi:hypothetical protein